MATRAGGALSRHRVSYSRGLTQSKKWLAVGILTILIVGYALAQASRSPIAGLETTIVAPGDIEETITALGKLQPSRYVDVGAQVSGQLKRILVKPGEQVKAGELLAEIDPQIQAAKVDADRAQLAQLKADLQGNQADAEYQVGEYSRQIQLMRGNATRDDTVAQVRRDMRSSAAQVESTRARIQQAESTLKADEAQLGYTRIFAPMAGTVVSVDAREGQTINANYWAPVLMRIADLTKLTVWTQVSEADVTRLHHGMPLYFTTLGYGGRRWTGTLRQILPVPPKLDTTSTSTDNHNTSGTSTQSGANNVVLYTALFDVANPKGELRPEMTAQVFFIIAAAKHVPTVPMVALSPTDTAAELYTAKVVVGRTLETRAVRIGVHDRFTAQVLAGLQPGDRIVTGASPDSGRPSLLGFRL